MYPQAVQVAVYRCYWCEWVWPFLPDFEVCPGCRERCYTGKVAEKDAPNEDDAHTWRQELDFGWWLWDTGRL